MRRRFAVLALLVEVEADDPRSGQTRAKGSPANQSGQNDGCVDLPRLGLSCR